MTRQEIEQNRPRDKKGQFLPVKAESVLKTVRCDNFTVPKLPVGLQTAIMTILRWLP